MYIALQSITWFTLQQFQSKGSSFSIGRLLFCSFLWQLEVLRWQRFHFLILLYSRIFYTLVNIDEGSLTGTQRAVLWNKGWQREAGGVLLTCSSRPDEVVQPGEGGGGVVGHHGGLPLYLHHAGQAGRTVSFVVTATTNAIRNIFANNIYDCIFFAMKGIFW